VSVRVVVVSYFSGAALATFLDSLTAASRDPVEVVVVDNGSTDGAPEAAAARPGVTLVRTGANLGYGRAANAGAAGAQTDWLLVANPDIVWTPGALDRLLAAGERWPRAGSLGPAIHTPDGALYPSARAFPSVGRGIGHAAFGWVWPANPWTRRYRREVGAPVEGPAGWLSGACLLVRRSAFETLGGFDPAYFMYCEDLDLGRRLAEAGWLNVHVPSAVVTHLGGHSTRLRSRRMLAVHHRSLYRYLARQYPGARFAPLRAVLAAGLVARYLLSLAVQPVREGARPTRRADLFDAA